jgi:hypothetical protein
MIEKKNIFQKITIPYLYNVKKIVQKKQTCLKLAILMVITYQTDFTNIYPEKEYE